MTRSVLLFAAGLSSASALDFNRDVRLEPATLSMAAADAPVSSAQPKKTLD